MKMERKHLLRANAVVAVLVAGVGAYGIAYQVYRDSIWRNIVRKIDRLALTPPKDMTELEWASVVYWTHNLHCNTIPPFYGDLKKIKELDAFIENAAERGPDMATIDGLWNRYAQISESGSQFRAKYESRCNEISAAIAEEGNDFADARSYRDFLAYVRSTQLTGRAVK